MAQNEYDVLVNLQANANAYEKEVDKLSTEYERLVKTGAVEESKQLWQNLVKAKNELFSIRQEMGNVAADAVQVKMGAGDKGAPKITSELLTGLKTLKGATIPSGGQITLQTLQNLWKANAGVDTSVVSEGQQKILMVLQGLAKKKVNFAESDEPITQNRYARYGNDDVKRRTLQALADSYGYPVQEATVKNYAGEPENALQYKVQVGWKAVPEDSSDRALQKLGNNIFYQVLPRYDGTKLSKPDQAFVSRLRGVSSSVYQQKKDFEEKRKDYDYDQGFGDVLADMYSRELDAADAELVKKVQEKAFREGAESDFSKAIRASVDDRDADDYLRKLGNQMGAPDIKVGKYVPKTFEQRKTSLDEYAQNQALIGETPSAHGNSYTEESVDNLMKKIIRFAYSGEIYGDMQKEGHTLEPWDSNITGDTELTLNSLKSLSSYIRQNQTSTMQKFTEGSAQGKSFNVSEITNFFSDLYNVLLNYASDTHNMNKTTPEVETRLKTMLVNIQKVLQAATQNPDEVLDQDNLTTLMSQMLTEVDKTGLNGKTYRAYSRDAVRNLRAREGLQTYDEEGNDVTGLYPVADIPGSATGHLYQFPTTAEEYRHSDEKDEMRQMRLGKAMTDIEAKTVLMDNLLKEARDLASQKKSQGFLTEDQQNAMNDAIEKANALFQYFVTTMSNQKEAWYNDGDVLPEEDWSALNSGISGFLDFAQGEKWVKVNDAYKPREAITQKEKSQSIEDIKANSEDSEQSVEEIEAEIQQLFDITGKNKENLLKQAKSWNSDLKEFNTFISNLLGKGQTDYTDYDIEDEQSLYKSDFVKDMDFQSLIGGDGYFFTPEEIMAVAKKMNADEYEYGMSKEDRDVLTLYQQLEAKLKQAKTLKSLSPYIEKYKDADKAGKTAISKEIREVLGDSTADYWKANKKELLKKTSSSNAETLTPVITSPAIPSEGQVIDVDYKEVNKSNQEAGKNIEETNRQAQSQVEETTKKVTEESQQVVELNNNFEVHKANVEEAIKAEQNKLEVSKTLTEQLDKEKMSLEALNKAFTDHAQVVGSASTAEAKVDTSAKAEQPKEEPKKEVRTPSEQGTVTSTWAKIANYDDVNHIYTDEKGNQLTSLTTLAGYLKGTTSNPTFKEDSKVIRNAVAGLNAGETLTPEMVGMNTKNFNSLTHTLAAIEKGNLEHEVIDLMAKTGSKSIEDLQKSNTMVESKWGSDGTQLKNGQTRMVKASEEYARVLQEKTDFLKKLGFENSEEQMLASTKAYMEALNAGGIALTKFSEVPMAATFSGNRGDYSFAFTPDQIGRDSAGNGVILDSKTGKTFGTESFQLAGQLYGILANKDNPEFEELYKGLNVDEDFTTYIAKIDGVFTQLIKHMQLTKEEFYDLLADANDIATGKQEPLTKYQQTARMNRELQTGRIGALDTSADGKTQSQNLSIGSGNFVSYAEGSKEENRIISEYLTEYNKKLSIQKQIQKISIQMAELSKDGTSVSEETLLSLKKQKEDFEKQARAQKEYMRSRGLEKKIVDVNGASQTRIGNVILSSAGAIKANLKQEIADNKANADAGKAVQAAKDKASSEYTRALNNDIDRQKTYNSLIQEQYELTQKIKRSSGAKNQAQQERLQTINNQLKAYQDLNTQISEEGQLLNQQADKQKLLDQLSQDTTLSEQERKSKEQEINKIFDDQVAKLQHFKISNSQSAGSNTVNTTQEINKYLKSLEQIGTLEREKARLQMKGGNLSGMAAIENRSLISNYDRQISGLQNQYSFKQLADGRTTLNGIELTEEEINRIEQERSKILDRNNAKMAQTQETVQQIKGFLEKLKDNFYQSFQQIGSYVMSLFSFQGIERAFSAVINRTSELDSKMVDLQIASGYTREEVSGMMLDFNKLGKQIGKTTSEIAEAANDWLRAGYDGAAASQLTQASMNLSTLGMINSADATSYLISVMKGWKLEASEIDDVVDKLVKTDMAAA